MTKRLPASDPRSPLHSRWKTAMEREERRQAAIKNGTYEVPAPLDPKAAEELRRLNAALTRCIRQTTI